MNMRSLIWVKLMTPSALAPRLRRCASPRLSERTLLSPLDAAALERTFKILANGTRLRLLHALARRPGLSVTELARVVGMKAQAVSNQLQKLKDQGILSNVRHGTSIHYRIVDPCTISLLDSGLCLSEQKWKLNR
jgi:ArsR family transcriptional regulator, lead/cadmium/zinc/bismuth-responsive transcriptional repressor